MSIERRVAWAVLGAVASKIARKKTRNALHTESGRPRLPGAVRRPSGMATALGWAIATGALMALSDVMNEQGKNAAQRR